MTYDEFCSQIEDKKNIVFLSDSELKIYKNATKNVNTIERIVNISKGAL